MFGFCIDSVTVVTPLLLVEPPLPELPHAVANEPTVASAAIAATLRRRGRRRGRMADGAGGRSESRSELRVKVIMVQVSRGRLVGSDGLVGRGLAGRPRAGSANRRPGRRDFIRLRP